MIKKTDFPTLRRITVTEDSAKFQEMFDQAMHHALINQSKVMTNSVQNAIYEMMKSNWTPGYTGPCYSQSESSAAATDRATASAAAGIGSQPMAPSTAPAGTGPIPMPQPFFQPTTFQPVGTPIQSAPRYTTASPMATSASRNLFSTPPGYVPTSSFLMPPAMMAGVWPQAQNSAGQTRFNQDATPSPQRSLPLVMHQQVQQQAGGPQASGSAPQMMAPHSQYDPYTIWATMNAVAHMMNEKAQGATHQHQHLPESQRQAPAEQPQ